MTFYTKQIGSDKNIQNSQNNDKHILVYLYKKKNSLRHSETVANYQMMWLLILFEYVYYIICYTFTVLASSVADTLVYNLWIWL